MFWSSLSFRSIASFLSIFLRSRRGQSRLYGNLLLFPDRGRRRLLYRPAQPQPPRDDQAVRIERAAAVEPARAAAHGIFEVGHLVHRVVRHQGVVAENFLYPLGIAQSDHALKIKELRSAIGM